MSIKLAREVTLKLVAAASPPDVRRGYASPFRLWITKGCALGSGFAPEVLCGQRPNQGPSPNLSETLTARQSLASHPAAKPQRYAALMTLLPKAGYSFMR